MTDKAKVDVKSIKDHCRGIPMSGINTPHIMLGQAGSMTGWHVEDLNFFSVNYLHSGAPKYWVVLVASLHVWQFEMCAKLYVCVFWCCRIPSCHEKLFCKLLKKLFPEQYSECESSNL